MIPASDITKWGVRHPWSTREQIEQDLLLSQALCEIANDRLLGEELLLRGGTAYHKLFLPQPLRFSEDLDYVRTKAGGIGEVMKRITSIGGELGYSVNTKIGRFPKVLWKGIAESGLMLRIKIEIDTFERSPVLPLTIKQHLVNTEWYSSRANVKTFQVEELIAAKLRALYQRSKGRDLFDIWLALEVLGVEPSMIIEAFYPYRPEGLSSEKMLNNLRLKLKNAQFLGDTDGLIVSSDISYDPQAAGELVADKLLSLV